MEFRTMVDLPERRLQLTHKSKVVLIGSCFTEHIGQRMSEALPEAHTDVNPNGILYNPGSIFTALQQLLHPSSHLEEKDYFEGKDGLWRNWLYSGEFAANTLEECREKIQCRQQQALRIFQDAEAIFITLSTDHGYYLTPECTRSSLVANCHKEPSRLFTEATIPYTEILEEGNKILHEIHEQYPDIQVIFTLSPYRYRKYGLHQNAVSKARLLHAIDEWCATNGNALYFPAYEIVVDELRDYRFYNTDMLHPSEQAVDYVWERFQEWAFTLDLSVFAQEKANLLRDFAHRPIHPGSTAAQQFFAQREKKKENFIKKWGSL